MFETENLNEESVNQSTDNVATQEVENSTSNRSERRTFNSSRAPRTGRHDKKGKPDFKRREKEVSDEKMSVLSVRRVAKVGEGSKRLSFAALVVVGDGKGSYGVATGKSRAVNIAIQKAATKARKLSRKLNLLDSRTLHYDVNAKFCASKVVLRKAKQGTGIKAGKIIRAILECLGGSNLDIVTKILGSRDPRNVANAVMLALDEFVVS